jgi:hypothetical protein
MFSPYVSGFLVEETTPEELAAHTLLLYVQPSCLQGTPKSRDADMVHLEG